MDLIFNALRVLTFRTVYGTAAANQQPELPQADIEAPTTDSDKQQQQQKKTRRTLAGSELRSKTRVASTDATNSKDVGVWQPTLPALVQSDSPTDPDPQTDLETGPEANLETDPQANLETDPQANLEADPQANLETGPQTDLETGPQADLETDQQANDLEATKLLNLKPENTIKQPLEILYEKISTFAKPLRWDSTGCSLANPRLHLAESSPSSCSFQLISGGCGYLISVTVCQEAPPDSPLTVSCDPAVPELASIWDQLVEPGAACAADAILEQSLMIAAAGLA